MTAGRARGGWERRKEKTDGGRQGDAHLFAEALTVLILNEEVKLIRFISNGCLKHGACRWANKSQSSQVSPFFPFERADSLLTCLSLSPLFNAGPPPKAPACQSDRCRHDHWPKSLFSRILTPLSLHFLHETQKHINQHNPHHTLHNDNNLKKKKPRPAVLSPSSLSGAFSWNAWTGGKNKITPSG